MGSKVFHKSVYYHGE